MLAHHQNDTSQFAAWKAAAIVEPNRVQPQFGPVGVALDVNVRRLIPIASEEEAAIRADAQNSGHAEK